MCNRNHRLWSFLEEVRLNPSCIHDIVLVNFKTVLGSVAIVVLLFFAIIFAMAASVSATLPRLSVAVLLFAVAATMGYYITRKPKTIIQRLEVSGEMKAVQLKCPHCSASVDAEKIRIVSGVPYATCQYCGQTFEVTEEPKW